MLHFDTKGLAAGALLLAACLSFGCGKTSSTARPLADGAAPAAPDGATDLPTVTDAGTGAGDGIASGDLGAPLIPVPPDCPDLFRQDVVRTYSLEIAPADWDALVAEFQNVAALLAGVDFTTYHPAIFRLDGETVPAAVKLHGQSSWLLAATLDGARAKMQFTVSFEETNKAGNFHGLSKLVFDMPRSDWTFLHDRLSHTWLRQIGIMAPCTASARLMINGNYYGLFAVEENTGGRLVRQYFPQNPDGDLWKGGKQPETNKQSPRWDRKVAFWNAGRDLGAIAAIVDLPNSLRSWAAEALLNNADGYYGGEHNFYIYDQGAAGFLFLPQDTDSTFDWLGVFDRLGANDHPIYFWTARDLPAPVPGPHWVTVLSDATWRGRYGEEIAKLLDRWNVAEIQGWIDTWSAQIAGDVATDPRSLATPADFQRAVAVARDVVAKRPAFLRTFVDCVKNGGADNDGDGLIWCADCRDDSADYQPSARDHCGNGRDENCNGVVDEGCPPVPDGGIGVPVPAADAGAGAPAPAADAGAPAPDGGAM